MEFITHLPFCYTKCLRSVSSSTNIDKKQPFHKQSKIPRFDTINALTFGMVDGLNEFGESLEIGN